MMQAAENRFANNLMITWNLMSVGPDSRHSHRRIRNPRSQTRVRSALVVVSHPFPKKSSQMPFVQPFAELFVEAAVAAVVDLAFCFSNARKGGILSDANESGFPVLQ